LAFLRRGRVNARLLVPSLPEAQQPFWEGLAHFIRQHRVSAAELNTFASRAVTIPPMREEVRRKSRHEFIVPIEKQADPLTRMQIEHRRRVRKAIKAGFAVRESSDPRGLSEHLRMIDSSLDRREARSEAVSRDCTKELLATYLETGFCTLFQAVHGGEVVSSMTVAWARDAGYLHTAGTNAAGRMLGASHFLVYEVLKATQARGGRLFNMGGVSDVNSGLAEYKKYFGAEGVALEAVELDFADVLRKFVNASVGGVRALLVRMSR
jgi:hypothetical protein